MAQEHTTRRTQAMRFLHTPESSQGLLPAESDIDNAFVFDSAEAMKSHFEAAGRTGANRSFPTPAPVERGTTPVATTPPSNGATADLRHVLTARQREVLHFIKSRFAETGQSPTIKETMQAFGFTSPNAVQTHVRALIKKGALERKPRAARGLRLAGELPQSSTSNSSGVAASLEKAGGPQNQAESFAQNGASLEASVAGGTVAAEVVFSAKHRTRAEFYGELHAHLWRLQIQVGAPQDGSSSSPCPDKLQQFLLEAVQDLHGAVLNDLDYFLGLEPTVEQVATWINRRVKGRLASEVGSLQSMTLWEQPSVSVTIEARRQAKRALESVA
ncbi:MAG: 6-carboxytetrahydropterin synthase [Chloroflexi bacterium]|nr:6-carboxytetrahydropterin synthase [Chloroflexota bacterium]